MIQRVSDPFDDLVMDSNKSLKSIYKGSRRNGVRMAKRKKGMTFIPYDYEAAYNKSLEDMNEFFVEQMFKHGKKVVYALKEIRAGDQFEVEIYPQFKKMDEVPPEGYKYDALEAVYIKGKSYEDIVRETGCGKNSPKKWCRSMTERLSIKLFGAKAIENDKIGVK